MKIKKKNLLKILGLVCFLLVFQIRGAAAIWCNWSPIAFQDSSSTQSCSAIHYCAIVGSGYFLKSYSAILDFLNKIEVGELYGYNYNELQEIIDNAINDMENARTIYIDLIQIADNTPYNLDVIKELQLFNYRGLCKDNGLISEIFWNVRKYLKKGDVRGIYHKLLQDTENILTILNDIETALYIFELPEVCALWDLNHESSKCLAFGQYTSMVFYYIMQNL